MTYPASLDSFGTINPLDNRSNPSLSARLNAMARAIVAIQSELGLTPSAGETDVDARMDSLEIVIPTGLCVPYAGSAAPTGWLLCDGSDVSRTTYSDLFAVIGTAFGVGDGSTTFGLPSFDSTPPIGKADSGTASTFAASGGSLSHSHSLPSSPNHSHSGVVNSAGAHFHNLMNKGGGKKRDIGGTPNLVGTHDHLMITESGHQHSTGSVSGHDGSGADPTQMPALAVNYIIKA